MANEADAIILPRTVDLVFWLFWLVSVIFLLLWDLLKAWKRGAPWIPGKALVLSALIIQLLSFIDYSHISVYSGSRYQSEKVEVILVKNQLVIDSGRLMMCVLIAYSLPGMARSGSIMDGSKLAVLALNITFHVVSELRSIWKVEKRNKSLSAPAALSDGIFSFITIILFVVITYLILLLIWATLFGRRIRRIMSGKIPSALSCRGTPCDYVLKCWIVARLSQPDYVFVRLGLRSMAWLPVTVGIGAHVIKWIYIQFTDHELLNSVNKRTLVQFVIGGQFVIVLIGWIVLFVEWVTSSMHGDISRGDYFKSMGIEDALTDLSAYFISLLVRDKRIQEKTIREMKKNRDIKSILWYLLCLVQKQFFSMQNLLRWLTSIKRMLSRIKTRVIESVSIAVRDNGSVSIAAGEDPEFAMYKETLNMFLFPGESALSLWKANQWGFRKVKGYMKQGAECSTSELTELLGSETGTAEGEADRGKAERLQQANKKSWKRTAVSLIHLMIYSYNDSDASVIEKAMQCYKQGWAYMDFVDDLDEEVESLGRQADEEFDSLQDSWNERAEPGMLEREIKQPLTDQLESLSNEEPPYLQNSRDSTEVAKYCLLETWTVMGLSAAQNNKIHPLRCALAKVYFLCLKEALEEAVRQKCSKLAEEGREEEIRDVASLLAKAHGVMNVENVNVGAGNDLENPVEPRHNTDQASTSSTTVNERPFAGDHLRRRTNNHYKSKFKVWFAQFIKDYVSSPWRFLEFFTAILALVLTLLQTIYTIHVLYIIK